MQEDMSVGKDCAGHRNITDIVAQELLCQDPLLICLQ